MYISMNFYKVFLILNFVSIFFLITSTFSLKYLVSRKKYKLFKNFFLITSYKFTITLIFPIIIVTEIIFSYIFNLRDIRIYISSLLLIIFIYIYLYYLHIKTSKKNKIYEQNNKLLNSIIIQQQNYYETLCKKYKDISKFKHDFDNHIFYIKELLENNLICDVIKYLNDLDNSFKKSSKKIYSGNYYVDIVLQNIFGNNPNIHIDWKGALPPSLKMSHLDICILFSNLFENALEASIKTEKPFIMVEIKLLDKNIFIKQSNSYNKNLIHDNTRLLTSKKRKDLHGFGISNIMDIINKYNGSFEYFETELFTIKIVLEDVIC